MAIDRFNHDGGNGTVQRACIAETQAKQNSEHTIVEVERSGDWMPADELRLAALGALEAGNDVTVNLGNIGHLDASALQVLLALDAEQKRRGRKLELNDASSLLLQWFDYAGAADHFSMTGRKNDA